MHSIPIYHSKAAAQIPSSCQELKNIPTDLTKKEVSINAFIALRSD